MMKLYTLIFAVMCAFGVYSQTVKKEYYDYKKTQIMAQYQVNSVGEKHGWFKGYDRDGVLIYEYNYSNGLWNGINKEYSVYGGRKLAQTETYKDGVLNGPAVYYFDGTLVKEKGSYKDGKMHGEWIVMQPFDSYGFSDELKKGSKYVKKSYFYDMGEKTYPDGEMKAYFYPSNKVYSIEYYENGRYSGNQVWYNPDGTVKAEQYYTTAEELKVIEEKARIEEEKAKIQRQIEKEKRDKAIIFANATLDSNQVEKAIKLYQDIGVNTEYLEFFLVLKKKYEDGEIDLGTTTRINGSDGNEVNRLSMGSQLVRQLTNWNLRQNTLKKHEDYCLHYIEIKELEIIEIERINKEVLDSYNSYINENVKEVTTTSRDPATGKYIVSKTYLKNKIIYTKSMIVLEAYMGEFTTATSLVIKQELGKKVIDSINALNQIPESEWKDLKKQLKKIDNPEQIKAILKI